MATEMKVPAVGESVSEVTIAQWFKKDGEYVEMDEVICEVESDKATFELNAETSGVLHPKVQEGDTIEVGGIVCEIDESAAPPSGGGEEKPAEKEGSESSSSEHKESGNAASGPSKTGEVKEMVVPAVGESITEVTIASWQKQDGDFVEMDEVLCEIESDKATFELNAEATGIFHPLVEEGATVEVGAKVCNIEIAEKPAGETGGTDGQADQKADAAPAAEEGDAKQTYATGHPSPAASKILQEKGISPEEVKGTGKDGRITKEDAMKAEKASATEEKKPEKEQPASTATEKPSEKEAQEEDTQEPVQGSRNSRRERMSNLRKTVAKRLVTVKNETAMLTTFNEVDMKPVMDLRKKYKDQFKEKYDVNLGFMSFFTKAVCIALQEWPSVNAQIDGEEIIYNDFCDVSIAVSSPRGLVVPVIRNAESMSFQAIEKEVVRLAKRARDNKLTIEEMSGGTFTITNGGIFGSMLSTPIINSPQSAILGMHNIVERPVAINGEVAVRPVMYIALSYDHRIIDGRESVSFLYRVKELVEDPSRIMLEI